MVFTLYSGQVACASICPAATRLDSCNVKHKHAQTGQNLHQKAIYPRLRRWLEFQEDRRRVRHARNGRSLFVLPHFQFLQNKQSTDSSSIQCSLEKPHCKICIKSKRECSGYDQDRTFILDQRTRKQILKLETKELSPDTLLAKTNSSADPTPSSPKELVQLQGSISTKNAYSSIWTITSPSIRSVYRQQIISEFLHSFTPNNFIQESPTKDNIMKSWFTLLPSHSDFTTALEATVLAVCTAKLGRLNNDPALVHESLKFYIQGLWELQRALYTPELMYKDETAASCMALIFYEVMECPDQTIKAWKKHVDGCATLFELRGPKAYGSEFGHELFLTFRQMEVSRISFSPFANRLMFQFEC